MKDVYAKIKKIKFINANHYADKKFNNCGNDLFSKKFKLKFQKTIKEKIQDGTILYRANFIDKKHFVANAVYFVSIKTTRGTIYCIKSTEHANYFCFTAHVFDRYRDRFNSTANRTNALLDFFTTYMSQYPLVHNNKLFMESGLLIGENHKVSDDVNIILFKTFVTLEMLRDNQQDLLIEQVKYIKECMSDVRKTGTKTMIKYGEILLNRWSALIK